MICYQDFVAWNQSNRCQNSVAARRCILNEDVIGAESPNECGKAIGSCAHGRRQFKCKKLRRIMLHKLL